MNAIYKTALRSRVLSLTSLALLSVASPVTALGSPLAAQSAVETPGEADLRVTRVRPWVVYGNDDRRDVFEESSEQRRMLAASTVALIEKPSLKQIPAGWQVIGESYQKYFNLCPTERFVEQDLAAICSGFLVGPDLVVTAGHCIMDETACKSTSFVFDYAYRASGQAPTQLSSDKVYSCSEIVKTSRAPSDFAIVRLDRKVSDRKPLELRRKGKPSSGDDLLVIGHPSGLPTKIADGAKVREVRDRTLTANLDTYSGNSGSAVFNANTLEVEGILVSGEIDFVQEGSCKKTYYCPNDACRGEDVTLIGEVLPFLPKGNSEPSSAPAAAASSSAYANQPYQTQVPR